MDDDYFAPVPRPLSDPVPWTEESPGSASASAPAGVVRLATFSMTKVEFIRTSHAVQKQSRRTVITLLALTAFYVLVGVLTHDVILWSVVGAVFVIYFISGVPRVSWAKRKKLFVDLTYTISPDGVTIHSPTASSDVKWPYFDRVVTCPDGYILHGGQQWRLVPGRAFASPVDEATFVAYASRHLPAPSRK
jgi:hypothetical protein